MPGLESVAKSLAKFVIYRVRDLLLPASAASAVILTYHSVSYEKNFITITPEEFEWQMEKIRSFGYRVISLAELEQMLDAGAVAPRTIVITFDDGRKDNYQYAFPVLKKFNMPATVFLATDYIGNSLPSSAGPIAALSEVELREMHASGLIDFEPHTASHPNMKKLTAEEAETEVRRSKERIEKLLGKICPYFAYPYGKFDEKAQKAVQAAGIRLAGATIHGTITAKSPRLALPRNGIDTGIRKMHFRSILAHGRI